MAHTLNSSIPEAEIGRSLSSRLVCSSSRRSKAKEKPCLRKRGGEGEGEEERDPAYCLRTLTFVSKDKGIIFKYFSFSLEKELILIMKLVESLPFKLLKV